MYALLMCRAPITKDIIPCVSCAEERIGAVCQSKPMGKTYALEKLEEKRVKSQEEKRRETSAERVRKSFSRKWTADLL